MLGTAGKCRRENCLPQPLSAGEVGVDLGFEFFDNGEAAVDFCSDPILLDVIDKRDSRSQYVIKTKASSRCPTFV